MVQNSSFQNLNSNSLFLNSVLRILSNGFYVATAGEVELNGTLRMEVDISLLGPDTDELLRILYWHTGERMDYHLH